MDHDQFVVRLVILFLGLFALTTLLGGIYLAAVGKAIPDALIAMGGTAIGAVGGILSRTSAGPTEVTVVNPADEPVPVEDT